MKTRLRKTRLAKGLPMCALARDADVSYSHLSRFERGWVIPSLQTAERLAQALGTTVEELYPDAELRNLGGVL